MSIFDISNNQQKATENIENTIAQLGEATSDDLANSKKDHDGVVYSDDGLKLLSGSRAPCNDYQIGAETKVICNQAFQRQDCLRQVNLSSQLLFIGDEAFKDCIRMRSPKFPDSLSYIGDYAFCHCSNLGVIKLPDSLQRLGTGAFSYCYKLRKVTLPGHLTAIPEKCFLECHHLDNVVVPKTVKKIGKAAFKGCGSLQDIMIPYSADVADDAFDDCPHVKIIITSEPTLEEDHPFDWSNTSVSNQDLNESVWDQSGMYISKDGKRLLKFLGKGTSLKIKKDIVTVCDDLCRDNKTLKSVDLSSIEYIGNKCFFDSRVKKVVLGNDLKRIGEGSFFTRSNRLIITGPEKFVMDEGRTLVSGTTMILLPPCNEAFYYDSECHGINHYAIPEGITRIGCYAGTKSNTPVFPNTLQSIGAYAFQDSYVDNVVLPSMLNTLEEGVFRCSQLKNITIPERVTELRRDVFWDCLNLQSVTILGQLKTFQHSLFRRKRDDLTFYFTSLPFEKLELHAVVPPKFVSYANDDADFEDALSMGDILVPSQSVDAYKQADGWKSYAEHIKAGNF